MTWYKGLEAYVTENVSLAPLTFYRVGGPAQYFASPKDEGSLSEVLSRAYQEGLPVRIMGQGSNLLVADEGVSGLVVRLPKNGFSFIERDGNKVLVGAGYSLPALVNWCVSRGLGGMENIVGVPGTVGAALRMNAGGKYAEIGDFVTSVRGCGMDGTPFFYSREACHFVYRDSGLSNRVVTACELNFGDINPEQAKARMKTIIDEKRSTQPLAARSAGCVFKNPSEEGLPSAGRIIDEMGFKGLRYGGAVVSPMHANFLVTEKGAKAADVIELINRIRYQAWHERGVSLKLEIAVWGTEPSGWISLGHSQVA